jgi:hypothetical protein
MITIPIATPPIMLLLMMMIMMITMKMVKRNL